MKTFKTFLPLVVFYSSTIFAGESIIPLAREARLPSNDLVFNGKTLSSKEALDLKNSDLSLLNPEENEIYNGENNLVDDDSSIAIGAGDSVDFQGSILSNSGLYRFNGISGNDGSVLTIHLDKTIHSMLLRKNLLRRLGYVIPTMKYISKLKVNFSSEGEKNDFLNKQIPENTLGAKERWVVSTDSNSVILQDVVVTVPSESDFYNVAMGIPSGTINSRTIRALVDIYGIADLNESVNQFSWIAGKIDNKAISLSHFTANEFNSSIDDVMWAQRKISKLSREDFAQIVGLSKFPKGVSEILIEKLISRRNAINKLLNINDAQLATNQKINIDGVVKEGKVLEQSFSGYSARFSYGDAETPLDQLQYYLYSKLESNGIDNLVNYVNKNLEVYDVSAKRTEYFKNQFETGLKHFVETGELLPIKVGTWTSPLVNFKLLMSRDIVIGNYLGTENLVQLADTFGAGVNLGVVVGVEGLPNGISSSITGSVSLVRSFTHLKPVKSLKTSLKEPFKNLFVPLLKKHLKDNFLTLGELKDFNGTTEERSKKVQEVFKEIDLNLGVGESLIMTDRIMPTASVDLNYSTGIVGLGVGVSGSIAVIKRVHFYKKAPQVLQVFDDRGHVKTIDLSMNLNAAGIPFLRINQAYDFGNYNIKSYMVNLSTNVDENPNLYTNALGVFNVLKNKNFEILNSNIKPVSVDAKFVDKTSGLSFLLWKVKKVKGQTFYDVQAKDGVNGKYFSYQKDFLTGANVESLSKQIINYYLESKVDPNISISDDSDHNPGETFYGKSHTETFRFEASTDANGKFEKKFLTLIDVRQGWTMSEKTLIKFITNVNKKFNLNLFAKEQIDFSKLKLYKIGYHLNLYEAGISKLTSLTKDAIDPIERKYKAEAGCNSDDRNVNSIQCGDLSILKYKIGKCNKNLSESDKAICQTELFEELYTDLKFDDFKVLIGENNFYLYGSVDGLRKGSEVMNDTIYSNSFGKIGSQYWNGPFDVVKSLIGISDGEYAGGWLRSGI